MLLLLKLEIANPISAETRRITQLIRTPLSTIALVARAKQITAKVKELFRDSVVRFRFIGAAEIVDLYRRTHSPLLQLPFVELLSSENSYAALVSLEKLAAFVTDEQGDLRQEFFDSNVRDFMGLNPVNHDIGNTLRDRHSPGVLVVEQWRDHPCYDCVCGR